MLTHAAPHGAARRGRRGGTRATIGHRRVWRAARHLVKARYSIADDPDRGGRVGLGMRCTAASALSPSARSTAAGSRPSLCRRTVQSRMSRQPERRQSPYLRQSHALTAAMDHLVKSVAVC